MDFMGIGPLELLLILLLGFLFLGPEKLPKVAAKAGQIYRTFRKATFDLSKTITEETPAGKTMDNIKQTIVDDLIGGDKKENAEKTTPAPSPQSESSEKIDER